MCDIVIDAPIYLLQLMCKGIGYLSTDSLSEVELLKLIRVHHDALLKNSSHSINTCLSDFEYAMKPDTLSFAAAHGLSPLGTLDDIKNTIVHHISEGMFHRCTLPACAMMQLEYPPGVMHNSNDHDDL